MGLRSLEEDDHVKTKRHKETVTGRTLCDDGGRGWSDASLSQCLVIGATRSRKDSFLQVSEVAWPCWYLDFRHLTSRTMFPDNTFLFLAVQIMIFCYASPRKLMQVGYCDAVAVYFFCERGRLVTEQWCLIEHMALLDRNSIKNNLTYLFIIFSSPVNISHLSNIIRTEARLCSW